MMRRLREIPCRMLACSRRLDSGEQVKSQAASTKRNMRGKKRAETGAGARKRRSLLRSLPFPALFFPSLIFRRRPNFLPAPHHPNAWNTASRKQLIAWQSSVKKERKGRISEEVYVLTIFFSTERELFTRQEGHNSRRNIYSAFHNQHRVVQSNQSPNVRRTGSVTEFFKVKGNINTRSST